MSLVRGASALPAERDLSRAARQYIIAGEHSGGGLLNRCRVKSSTGGSNPPLSAIESASMWLSTAEPRKARQARAFSSQVLPQVSWAINMRNVFATRGGNSVRLRALISSCPAFGTDSNSLRAGISFRACSSSEIEPKPSRAPCMKSVGVLKSGKCFVRSSVGRCGG
jgi:hypothetical protein